MRGSIIELQYATVRAIAERGGFTRRHRQMALLRLVGYWANSRVCVCNVELSIEVDSSPKILDKHSFWVHFG